MTVAQMQMIVLQTSPVAIQSSPTPGPVDLAPAAHAASPLTTPAATHPNASSRYAALGRGRIERRARRAPSRDTTSVASHAISSIGSQAAKSASSGRTYGGTSAELRTTQAMDAGNSTAS